MNELDALQWGFAITGAWLMVVYLQRRIYKNRLRKATRDASAYQARLLVALPALTEVAKFTTDEATKTVALEALARIGFMAIVDRGGPRPVPKNLVPDEQPDAQAEGDHYA